MQRVITRPIFSLACSDGVWNVNEQMDEIGLAWHARPAFRDDGGTNNDCAVSEDAARCFQVPAARHRPLVADKVAVYHYITKSVEDFEAKLVRGAGVPYFQRDMDWFHKIERCATSEPA